MESVHVGSFVTGVDAELVRGLLEGAGIGARIDGDLLAGAAQPLQGMGGVRVYVAAADAEQARELIFQHERELAQERKRIESEDERVLRAYRLALIGGMLCPVLCQAISLAQLTRIDQRKLSPKGRRQFAIAVSFDLVVIFLALLWLSRLI